MSNKFLKTAGAGVVALGLGALLAQAAAPAVPQGAITEKVFLNIGTGTAVSDLTSNAKFPNSPDILAYPSYFELWATGDINTPPASDLFNGYGSQMIGYFYPDNTGPYVFYISSDDTSALYLSTDQDPAHKKLIAQESGYSNPRGYTIVGGGASTAEEKCSQTFTNSQWPVKDANGYATISLTKGQAYYIEALHKEGSGGDNLSVSIDASMPIPGTMLSSFDKATGPLTIVTQPQSSSVTEGQSAAFSVSVNGTPPYTYQWQMNASPIPDATNSAYTMARVYRTDNGAKFTVAVTGGQGNATSSQATLTVVNDTAPPTVASAAADGTFTSVKVTFSEPLDPTTAQTASNYKVNNGVTVTAAALGATAGTAGDNIVILTTSKQAAGSTFTLTVSNVKDVPGNAIAANTTVQFRSFVYLAGTILHKKYDNCNDGFTLANFLADPRFPSNPDREDLEQMWEYPANGVGRVPADPVRNYIDTLEGFFIPPTTGDYVFYICGDDEYYLYLSTDENPANMVRICSEPGGWSDNRAWNTAHSGTVENWNSSTYAATEWAGGNTITLTAGQPHYMLAIHHDHSWSGGDWFGATYQGPGDTAPADGNASKLTGSVAAYNFDPTGASISFSTQPENATAVVGSTATFSSLATGTSAYGTTVLYQWQSAPANSSAWVNISGAIAASFQTPLLALTDSGTQFRVVASVAPISLTSSVATVTVTVDTAAPVPTVGAMLDATAGVVDVGVAFDKPVDDTSGSLLANYTVSPGTITSLTWYTNRFTANSQNPLVMSRKQSALLKVTGLSGSGTLTIKNVSDTLGNKITSTTVPFTVDTNMAWGVVGANTLGGINAVVPVAANGFDVYSDGTSEWGNYDETTFVYQKITGDFDKKVRVEYQDGSSQWARAGLIVRDVPNFGVDAATQQGSQAGNTPVAPYDGLAGRYQKLHVNPVGASLTGPGTPGNASWEGNRRLDTGGGCTSAVSSNNATPQYPNAWCRIQRKGQTFTIFRSDDGVKWLEMGATTWGVDDVTKTNMPATVYVGPEFSPENGNVTVADDQGTFLARFRDYGDFSAVTPQQPTLTVTKNADGTITLTYTGTLQSSATVKGPFSAVAGAVSPFKVDPKSSGAAAATFYRAGP